MRLNSDDRPQQLDEPAAIGRADPAQLRQNLRDVVANPVVSALMEASEGLFAILNQQRQVLAVNNTFLELLGVADPSMVHGLRVGEVVGCVRAHVGPDGCGTGVACQTCGAVVAMVLSQTGVTSEQTCCLQRQTEEGISDVFLRVRCQQLEVAGQQFVMIFMRDVSDDQERSLLERSFVHDISNILSVLAGQGDLFEVSNDFDRKAGLAGEIHETTLRLIREVALHRSLIQGGKPKDLLHLSDLDMADHLRALVEPYRNHRVGRTRNLELDVDSVLVLRSDPVLLDRVIGNLVQNALEAGDDGEMVRVSCFPEDGGARIEVWNEQYILAAVQARIFQRNFSSKAKMGRGLGTYMAKRIAEQMLGGHLGFVSDPERGTTFILKLPRHPPMLNA